MFVDGLTRWGRKASANAMRSFRNALAGWHNRMMDLPSQDIIQLADWFTMDGTQWIIAVSYTHLDVYKRQLPGSPGSA